MSAKNRTALGIFLMVLIAFVILIIFASFTINSLKFSRGDYSYGGSNGESIVAVVEVKSVIMDSKKTIEKLHKAEKDKKIKAIIVRIDSPGGAVGPSQEIYEEIKRIDKVKPTYASFGAVAASGGYYIGAAAREIYANPGTMTGSIGVIMNFVNMSKLYEFAKISPQTIKAGKYKDIGSPNRSMTGEEKLLMDTMIKTVHKQFIDDVYSTRKKHIKKERLLELAQGQIFTGEKAKKEGLIDGLGGLWALARHIKTVMKLDGEIELEYIKTKKEQSFWRYFDQLEQVASNIDWSALSNKSGPMFLYRP